MTRHILILITGALLLLAACSPAETDQAAQDAVEQISSALPSGVVEQAGDALASAAANASDVLSDADVNELLGQAQVTIENLTPSDLRLENDQDLVLSTSQQVAGVTNYRWIITEAPEGAESVQGAVISENSSGQLTLAPSDYAQYFPVSGTYTVTLELTYEDGHREQTPITITIP